MVKPGLTKPSRSQATVNNTGPAMAPSASQRAGSLVAEGADADERSNDEVATGLLLAVEICGWVANEHRTRGVGDQAPQPPQLALSADRTVACRYANQASATNQAWTSMPMARCHRPRLPPPPPTRSAWSSPRERTW